MLRDLDHSDNGTPSDDELSGNMPGPSLGFRDDFEPAPHTAAAAEYERFEAAPDDEPAPDRTAFIDPASTLLPLELDPTAPKFADDPEGYNAELFRRAERIHERRHPGDSDRKAAARAMTGKRVVVIDPANYAGRKGTVIGPSSIHPGFVAVKLEDDSIIEIAPRKLTEIQAVQAVRVIPVESTPAAPVAIPVLRPITARVRQLNMPEWRQAESVAVILQRIADDPNVDLDFRKIVAGALAEPRS